MADMDAYVQQIQHGVRDKDPVILGILVAVAVGILTLRMYKGSQQATSLFSSLAL